MKVLSGFTALRCRYMYSPEAVDSVAYSWDVLQVPATPTPCVTSGEINSVALSPQANYTD
jgi:hypothetical protein